MTDTEYQSQFSMWCMFSTPLLISFDLFTMNRATLDIHTNKELIANNQERLGQQTLCFFTRIIILNVERFIHSTGITILNVERFMLFTGIIILNVEKFMLFTRIIIHKVETFHIISDRVIRFQQYYNVLLADLSCYLYNFRCFETVSRVFYSIAQSRNNNWSIQKRKSM